MSARDVVRSQSVSQGSFLPTNPPRGSRVIDIRMVLFHEEVSEKRIQNGHHHNPRQTDRTTPPHSSSF